MKRMAMPSWVARKMTCSPSVILAVMSSSSLSMPMAMMPRAMTLEKSLSGVFLTVPFCVAKKMNLPSSSRSRMGRMARTFSPGCRSSMQSLLDLQPAAPMSGIS